MSTTCNQNKKAINKMIGY